MLQRNVLKLWQVFVDKALEKIDKNKNETNGDQVRPIKRLRNINIQLQGEITYSIHIPEGPTSKMTLPAGVKCWVCFEKSEFLRQKCAVLVSNPRVCLLS